MSLTPFGAAIKNFRRKKNMRLLEMADKLGHSASYVSGVEIGRLPLHRDYLEKIIHHFDFNEAEEKELRYAASITVNAKSNASKGNNL